MWWSWSRYLQLPEARGYAEEADGFSPDFGRQRRLLGHMHARSGPGSCRTVYVHALFYLLVQYTRRILGFSSHIMISVLKLHAYSIQLLHGFFQTYYSKLRCADEGDALCNNVMSLYGMFNTNPGRTFSMLVCSSGTAALISFASYSLILPSGLIATTPSGCKER